MVVLLYILGAGATVTGTAFLNLPAALIVAGELVIEALDNNREHAS